MPSSSSAWEAPLGSTRVGLAALNINFDWRHIVTLRSLQRDSYSGSFVLAAHQRSDPTAETAGVVLCLSYVSFARAPCNISAPLTALSGVPDYAGSDSCSRQGARLSCLHREAWDDAVVCLQRLNRSSDAERVAAPGSRDCRPTGLCWMNASVFGA